MKNRKQTKSSRYGEAICGCAKRTSRGKLLIAADLLDQPVQALHRSPHPNTQLAINSTIHAIRVKQQIIKLSVRKRVF